MRVLYFSRDYTVHDQRFLTALADTPHEVFFLRLESNGLSLKENPLPRNIDQIQWGGGYSTASWVDGPKLLISLKKVLADLKPDLVHAGPIQRSALLVALAGFRPLVSVSWGYDLIHDAKRSPFWRWATQFTLKRSAVMVGDCKTIHHLAKTYGMPGEQIVTFPWGIDLELFSPAQRTFQNEPFTLLSVRSWEPIYGVDIIARAFVQAAQSHSELHLVMLGDGSLANQLYQIFQQGNVLDRITFPGLVKQSELPDFYRTADLYLSASHSDGTSISLLEAMGCGRPVLVSDIPGNKEWVTPGKNGWLFPDGNVEALSQAIVQVLSERPKLPEMGLSARLITEKRANWKTNFPLLLDAYNMAVNQPN
ncbi:glycosyltransferase family 4 protein [Chloroflexota bacterium]